MSKANIVIEYNGKRYRVAKTWKCRSKRDCDLFQRGVCDDIESDMFPCDEILEAFQRINAGCPLRGFKEVRT